MESSMLTIKRKQFTTAIPFEELSVGEVFKDTTSLNSIFMKIKAVTLPGSTVEVKNAINLEDGYAGYFAPDEEVTKFKATLVEE